MTKTDLRKMIREEIQKELYSILPELLREALAATITKTSNAKRRPVRRPLVEDVEEDDAPKKEFDGAARNRLAAMLGYGDITAESIRRPVRANETTASSRPPATIAGVTVEGGLMAKEAAAGMTNLRKLSWDDSGAGAGVTTMVEGAVPQQDAGPELPSQLVNALGTRAKKVFDAAQNRAKWRPGKKLNG